MKTRRRSCYLTGRQPMVKSLASSKNVSNNDSKSWNTKYKTRTVSSQIEKYVLAFKQRTGISFLLRDVSKNFFFQFWTEFTVLLLKTNSWKISQKWNWNRFIFFKTERFFKISNLAHLRSCLVLWVELDWEKRKSGRKYFVWGNTNIYCDNIILGKDFVWGNNKDKQKVEEWYHVRERFTKK